MGLACGISIGILQNSTDDNNMQKSLKPLLQGYRQGKKVFCKFIPEDSDTPPW